MLSVYRVLDLTNEKGFFCGRLLGDLGADVVKIEPPGGDPSRHLGPFFHDDPGPEKGLNWLAFNASKRGITLDILSDDGREVFKKLAAGADVVIESFQPGYMENIGLGYEILSAVNPGIVLTRISAYGQEGPYRDYKADELVYALSAGWSSTSATRTVRRLRRPTGIPSSPAPPTPPSERSPLSITGHDRPRPGRRCPTQMGLGFVGSAEQQLPWVLQQTDTTAAGSKALHHPDEGW
jgi:crotonobetainyl-CoA:carnitine CoA-transferase CaiB-like acyl-CoA transferase